MLNSTQKETKILQNQSNEGYDPEKFNKIYEPWTFQPNHVHPYGELWKCIPEKTANWVHLHDYLEIGRCVTGSGIFHVNGKIIRVKAPCTSILYEGEWHSAQSNPYDESEWNFLYIDLNYFLSRVDTSFPALIKGLQWQSYEFPHIMSYEEFPEIARLVDAIFEESSHIEEGGQEKLTGLILALLIQHSRHMKAADRKTVDRRTVERISPAVSFMNAHYSEPITVQKLAALCFISPATLRRAFHELFNLSPIEYLHNLRVKYAAVMLVTTHKTVLDIALETGYPTVSSFNRQFTAHYRISPRDYRKKNKNKEEFSK